MPTAKKQIIYQIYVDDRTEKGTRGEVNGRLLPEILTGLKKKASEDGLESKLKFKRIHEFGRELIAAAAYSREAFEKFYKTRLTERLQGGWVPEKDRILLPENIVDERYRGMVSISILNKGRPKNEKQGGISYS